MRKLVSSGSPYEPVIGLSRAVRVGPHICVSATAPIGPDGRTVGVGDAAAQARRVLEIIAKALEDAGGSMDDVVRTRTFLTNMDDWKAVGRVHGEVFSRIRPASFFVEVNRFIDPEWLVEMEADAIIEGESHEH